jgi:putative restriction endonuclease
LWDAWSVDGVDNSYVLSRMQAIGGNPDKALLALLVLGRLVMAGNGEMPWSTAEVAFADMTAQFRPAAVSAPTEADAARAFLGLSHDRFWGLDVEVPTDRPRALNERRVSARLDPVLEQALLASPGLARQAARQLVADTFPDADAEAILAAAGFLGAPVVTPVRAADKARPRGSFGLDAYLKVTVSEAREQFRDLLVREEAAEGRRQVDFIPVETLLCLAASFQVNHRRYGGSTAHTAPTPVPELARLFKRRPSSILAKMANLDGSRSHGASHDASAGATIREDPTLFTHIYRVLLYAARAEGIGAVSLPDFLNLEDGGEMDLLGQDELASVDADDLRPDDDGPDPDPETERIRLAAARVGQHLFARNVLANCGGTCVFCGLRPGTFGARRMLLAGHIKPWRESSPTERLDTRNGIAACPSHDVAFDTGLLTIEDDLSIRIGAALEQAVLEDELTRRYYGRPPVLAGLLFPASAVVPHGRYLEWHRRYVFGG